MAPDPDVDDEFDDEFGDEPALIPGVPVDPQAVILSDEPDFDEADFDEDFDEVFDCGPDKEFEEEILTKFGEGAERPVCELDEDGEVIDPDLVDEDE